MATVPSSTNSIWLSLEASPQWLTKETICFAITCKTRHGKCSGGTAKKPKSSAEKRRPGRLKIIESGYSKIFRVKTKTKKAWLKGNENIEDPSRKRKRGNLFRTSRKLRRSGSKNRIKENFRYCRNCKILQPRPIAITKCLSWMLAQARQIT